MRTKFDQTYSPQKERQRSSSPVKQLEIKETLYKPDLDKLTAMQQNDLKNDRARLEMLRKQEQQKPGLADFFRPMDESRAKELSTKVSNLRRESNLNKLDMNEQKLEALNFEFNQNLA